MKTKIALATVICLLVAASLVSVASAGDASTASVWTTDSGGTHKNQFDVGETVYIHFSTAPAGTTADIEVRDSANNIVAGPWTNQVPSTVLTFTPTTSGYYYVIANGQPAFSIAVGTFFVVPESALGALMVPLVGLAAYVTFGLFKAKRSNKITL
jgi:hypothetical protein